MIDRRRILILATLATVAIAIPLVSCDGFFPSSNTITALSISPTGPFVKPQATQQFTATATFGNNTMGDATNKVTWTSSDTSKATISTAGLATATTTTGTTTITAKSGSVSASTVLTVSNRTVLSIDVTPSPATIQLSLGTGTQQFNAMANFDDNSSQDVTTLAGWTSSNQSVATINTNGLATGVATGTTTIRASYGGKTGTASLTVQ